MITGTVTLVVTVLGGVIAAVLGLLLAIPLGLTRFPGRSAVLCVVEAWRGLPSVVIGLAVLAVAGLGRPPSVTLLAIAQAALATPLVAALASRALARSRQAYGTALYLCGIGVLRRAWLLAGACRASLARAVVAGFARALVTAGAVLVLGGRTIPARIAITSPPGHEVLVMGLALTGASLVLSGLVMLLGEGER